jgi:anaerobic selenocysteine-containing dehydrogenase
MTNHWNDIDNTSLVFAYGANPAENHPACMAHVNAARFGSKQARLIVVDPRLTRTARQCDPARGDVYVRIRPGTNVAFTNGLLNWIFNNISGYDAQAARNMLAWHNGFKDAAFPSDPAPVSLSAARTFVDDAGTTRTLDTAAGTGLLLNAKYDGVAAPSLYAGYPKYCDSRFKVNGQGDDYERATLTVTGNTDYTTDKNFRFSEFPVIVADVSDPDSVYQKLAAHVAAYDTATVADICGCTEAEIVIVAKALVDNSRFKSSDFGQSVATPQAASYKATTILYAMGQTQHSNASQNIKDLAVIQTLMGNMGRSGGGINALRGIHNVQGSTDLGLLFDSIPGYGSNPLVNETYAHYSNTQFGNRVLNGTNSAGAKVYTDPANLGLQQRGFHNMTQEFFADGKVAGTDIEKLYDLWPKGNGVQHITTFRYMALGSGDANRIISSVIWGQNPAVTEPNQSAVRLGLRNLDLMVAVDMFETETAACDRKSDGVTYLIPACSHVEEAGSVTNSGRWLQWRERATAPVGNSKADLELLLHFAYALDKAGAFAHMTNVPFSDSGSTVATSGVWSTLAAPIAGPAYKVLYGDKYGWTPRGATAFEAITGTTERWAPGATAPDLAYSGTGSEIVAERVYIELCRPLAQNGDGTANTTSGGTHWIYSGAAPAGGYSFTMGNANPACKNADGTAVSWVLKNRAKSRNNTYKGASTGALGDTTVADASANNFPRWGWSWLLNRRVFYNNGEIAADQSDTFVSPGAVCLMFTEKNAPDAGVADWSLVYRKYKTFADVPSVVQAGDTTSPHFIGSISLAGRFPGHTEPYESPREDLVTTWGHNQAGASRLVPSDTAIGTFADYPLVLTSIRCVEHFQGGPITRNNSWNVEAEPVPWIEINSVDARKYNIVDGQWVNVITARSNSTSDQMAETPANTETWARGFKARVGVGLQSNQRVAPGVVAIPWHWGDKGLSTGSRANDLCIDAYDANTMIPEYKACLCKIVGL